MSKKLYVGNMPYNTTQEELEELFSAHGNVTEAKIIKDQISNRSKGFGFVSYEDEESGQSAIDALNGKEFNGRTLKVNVAEDKNRGGSSPRREYSQGQNNRRRY